MTKKTTIFDATEEWCDYELLGVAATLLEKDQRSTRIAPKDFNSIAVTTEGFVSLVDLAEMIYYIADCLEDEDLYQREGVSNGN